MNVSEEHLRMTAVTLSEMLTEFDVMGIMPPSMRDIAQMKIAVHISALIVMIDASKNLGNVLNIIRSSSPYFYERALRSADHILKLHKEELNAEVGQDIGNINQETLDILQKLSKKP